MIIIAYDEQGRVRSIVNAKNEALANAYWHGAGIVPHTTKTLNDFISLDNHPTGVIPIVTTTEVVAGSMDKNAKLVIIKR